MKLCDEVYLMLFHGRATPTEQPDEIDPSGPVFGPLVFVHTTYNGDLKLKFVAPYANCCLQAASPGSDIAEYIVFLYGDVIYYDGIYYGDWSVFNARHLSEEDKEKLGKRLVAFNPERAKAPAKSGSAEPAEKALPICPKCRQEGSLIIAQTHRTDVLGVLKDVGGGVRYELGEEDLEEGALVCKSCGANVRPEDVVRASEIQKDDQEWNPAAETAFSRIEPLSSANVLRPETLRAMGFSQRKEGLEYKVQPAGYLEMPHNGPEISIQFSCIHKGLPLWKLQGIGGPTDLVQTLSDIIPVLLKTAYDHGQEMARKSIRSVLGVKGRTDT